MRPMETLLGWHRRYGDLFTAKFLIFGTGVYVADPAEIRALMTGDQSDLHAGEANAPLAGVLGNHSVLVLDGPEHMRQRKLLLPPFQGSAVTAFRDVIRDVAEAEVARWRPGQELVMRDRMRALTFEVICRAVFGVTEPERVERLRAAMLAAIDSGATFLLPGPLKWDLGSRSPAGRLKQRIKVADDLIYEEIARRRAEPDLEERTDVLSLLMRARDEDGSPMTDVELRDELVTMLAAGHETTATGLAFAFDLLLHDPPALERLRSELAAGDDAYLEAVVSETLRIRPVIDGAERTLKKPRTIGGWDLPPGIRVYPAILLVHHREDLYPEPHRFRPERFLNGGVESYAWLPFGGGIRRCLGMAFALYEMKIVLARLLASADLELADGGETRPVTRGFFIAPEKGLRVRLLGRRIRRAAA